MLLPTLKIKKGNFLVNLRFGKKKAKARFFQLFLIVIMFLTFGSFYVRAQVNFSKKTFTTNNGLSNNFVQDITQDKNGFLWISTWDGLNRFDGYEFKRYFHKPNDSTTFSFFLIEKSVIDNLNNVWVVCPRRAVVIYNPEKDNFEKFRLKNYHEFIVSDMLPGNGNDIWMYNQDANNLYHYNQITSKLDSFSIVNNEGRQLCKTRENSELIKDNKENFWVTDFLDYNFKIYRGSFSDSSHFCLKGYEIAPLNYSDMTDEDRKPTIYRIYIDKNKATWLFTSFGLFYKREKDEDFALHNADIEPTNFPGKQHFYWSDLYSGIHIIRNNEIQHIQTVPENYTGSIFIDSKNTIWTANVNETFDRIGLNRYIQVPELIEHDLTTNNELGNQHIVVPILTDKFGNTWIGTIELDYLFKKAPDGTITKVDFLKNIVEKGNYRVKSMIKDSLGIWIGCTNDLLVYYDYKNKRFTPYPIKDPNISDIGLHNILKVGNNIIINGFNNSTGIHATYKFNIISRSIEITHQFEYPCLCLVNDEDEGFWLGSLYSTIIHLDANLKETAKYQIGKGDNLVEHICMGDSSDVWAALMGGGLVHFNPGSGEMETYTMADGLSSNTVSSILKDKNGKLWLSTNLGISRLNPITKHFRNFGKAEGVMIREFNSDSYHQSPDGMMYFGGVGGMISFHPDSIEKKLSSFQSGNLCITDFSVSGISRYFKPAINNTDTVILNKGDNNFQLTFAKIEFNYPEKIRYRYRLQGVDKNWIETDYRHRDISYANLTPGKYKQEIEATNFEDEWTDYNTLLVVIPAFYYQTWWFKICLSFLIVAIAAAFIVFYNRQIRISAKQKQAELKLESLRGQMNPHFIFNALNSINYFISNNDKRSANSYIADFSNLIRNFLNNLSCNYIPLNDEIKILEDYLKLEHLRFADKFDYSLRVDTQEDLSNISVFPGMVQPFIENAIWHGVRGLEQRKGFINISFTIENQTKACCIIEDDGIGRKQAEKYRNKIPGKKSRGIGIVMERLKVVNNISEIKYDVTIKDKFRDKKDTGTIVAIDLPIKYEKENNCD